MALHTVSGRWQLGVLLALTTALMWATLPLGLKVSLEQVDAWTITWLRLLVAALVLGVWLGARGKLGALRGLPRSAHGLLLLACIMLAGNFIGYLVGLQYTTPANAQLLIQAAPLLLAVGGILVFREPFSVGQWLGVALVAAGLLIFALDQSRHAVVHGNHYVLGALIVIASAVVWAVYALAQKQLLMHLDSKTILCVLYAGAAVLLSPLATPSSLLGLDWTHGLALAYCVLNTLVAYGAFAEALAHWEASRVGIVLALTPVLTVLAVDVSHTLNPGLLAPEHIGLLGVLGCAAVVLGSVVASLSRKPAAVSSE